MICKHCKTINSDDAKFCRCCGVKFLTNQFKACTNRNCKDYMKSVLPSKALFCPRCGHSIEDVENQAKLELCSILKSLRQDKEKNKNICYRIGKYQFVDLGLTHKWATCNLGAVSFSCMYFGEYYAWGETDAKVDFSRDNHRFIRKKRFFKSDIYENLGGSISGTDYDPVTMFFQSKKCHLPTEKDWMELVKKCAWYKCGTYGYKVVGPNRNHIVLPYWDTIEGFKKGIVYNDYLCGDFPKEKKQIESFVQVLRLTDDGCSFVCCGGRYLGRMVRPVCDM